MSTRDGASADAANGEAEAPHEAACLRPFCCNPFAAFSAFSRVGGWTPALPEGAPAGAAADTGETGKIAAPLEATPRMRHDPPPPSSSSSRP